MRIWERLTAYHRFWRYRLRGERRELAFMRSQKLAGATILDIGANRGAYSYWMNQAVGHQGRVIAFEPQPELVDYLGDLKNTFRLGQLTIVHSGLSDKPGELTMVRPRNHWGGASFHPEQAWANVETDTFRVPVTTLDDHLSKYAGPPIRFIKCDVQDHEIHVFRGAVKMLEKHRPTILVEQTDRCAKTGELASLLTGLGYRGSFLHGDELVDMDQLSSLRSKIRDPYLNYIYRHAGQAAQRAAA